MNFAIELGVPDPNARTKFVWESKELAVSSLDNRVSPGDPQDEFSPDDPDEFTEENSVSPVNPDDGQVQGKESSATGNLSNDGIRKLIKEQEEILARTRLLAELGRLRAQNAEESQGIVAGNTPKDVVTRTAGRTPQVGSEDADVVTRTAGRTPQVGSEDVDVVTRTAGRTPQVGSEDADVVTRTAGRTPQVGSEDVDVVTRTAGRMPQVGSEDANTRVKDVATRTAGRTPQVGSEDVDVVTRTAGRTPQVGSEDVKQASTSGMPKARDPHVFEGRDRADFNQWTRSCERIFLRWPVAYQSDQTKTSFASEWLGADQQNQWERFERSLSEPEGATWAQMKKEMLDSMGSEGERRQTAYERLRVLVQGAKTPTELMNEMKDCWEELQEDNEANKVITFIAALNRQIRDRMSLMEHAPHSLVDAEGKANKQHRYVNERRDPKRERGEDSKGGYPEWPNKRQDRMGQWPSRPSQQGPSKPNWPGKPPPTGPLHCMVCRRISHKTSDCWYNKPHSGNDKNNGAAGKGKPANGRPPV